MSSSAGGVSLPPLRRSAESLEACLDQGYSAEASLLRQTRKAELMSCVLGHSPGSQGLQTGLLLDLELKEQKLAAKQQHRPVRLILEGWVDEVLTNSANQQQLSLHRQLQPQSPSTGALRGAAAAGLSRQQLLAAGLSSGAVEQLYRCLYVYTMGFVDTIKELLGLNEHRQELLQAIWQAFLLLAEHSMKATFKSDYLALVTAAGTAATELLCTKHTLAEVRQDNAAMVKDLGSLSAAEAEASAQRSSLKAQVDDLKAALATEQTAHRRAVQQYVDALDAKSAMQLQFEASQQALQELYSAHKTLQQQHQELQQQHSGLVSQCCAVRDICKHLDEALGLDPHLVQQVQQWREANGSSQDSALQGLQEHTQHSDPMQPPPSQQQDQQGGQDVQRLSTDGQAPLQKPPAAEPDGATDLQPLAEKLEEQMQAMYASWRSATNTRDVALTERFRMADQLRDSDHAAYQLQQQHKALQQVLQEAQQHLSDSQAENADLIKRLTGAHESLAQAQLDLGEAQDNLQHTRDTAAALDQRCMQLDESIEQLHDEVADLKSDRLKLEAQLTAAARRLGDKHRLVAELSKGFAVAMQGAMANQTARGVSDRLLKAEKAKGAHMNSSLNSKDRLLHDLQAQVREQGNQVTKLQAELQLLEGSLQDSQRQAMALGTRLQLTETKNDELISQTQTQSDQLAEAATTINKLVTRLEQTKQQLDKANTEIKDLKDAAQVAERIISDGRLLAKSLTADVERITREKQVAQERAETTKARLELEVQRLSGELAAAECRLELKAADLEAERDRVAAQATLLQCKRGKKRRWKEAYHTASDEVVALHTQLLAKHKDLEVLEGHLNQLQTELAMLGINTSAGLNTEGLRPRSASSASSRPQTAARPSSALSAAAPRPSRPTSAQASAAVGLAEARSSHAAAAAELARLQEQWFQLDKQVEEQEAAQQQLLLSLADARLSEAEIKYIRVKVEGKRAQVQDLRQQRLALVTARGAAAAELRKAELVLRDAHHARLQQRQLLLEQQTMKASDLINAAAMGQLAAAEEAELGVRAALAQQVAAFETVQADKAALEQRMQDLQAGIDTFMNRISGLEGDKAGLEEQLRRTHHTVTCLQAEVSAVNSERDRIRSNASQAEHPIAALESELEAAKQAVTLALKGMEAKHAAERQLQEQRLVAERNKAGRATEAAEAAVAALKGRITHLRTALIEASMQCYGYACVSVADRIPLLDRNSSSGSQSSNGSSSAANSSSGGRTVPLLPLQGQPLTQYGARTSPDQAKLAPQPVSAPGVRWLYMHLPDSPWRRARLLLLQPQQEAPEGLLRQNSSVPSTPRGSTGRTLAIPPSLPGFSFGPENLLVLIGELLLHKIDLDAASDERLLMCTSAAAAGVASASSTTASSRAASWPATAASRPSTASTSAGSSGGSAGSVAAANAAGALLLGALDEEGQGSAGPLRGGSAAAVAAWWSTRFRKDLEGAVFDYFMTRCGCRLLADAHCSALVLAVHKSAGRSKRAALFGRCLGLLEPAVPPAGVGALLHFLAQLHSTCPGPLSTEATEGSSQVVARTAAQFAMQALQPTGASPCAEVSSLSAAITAAAGGSSDNTVEVDTVLELLEGAWGAQRAVEQQQLERILAQTDTRGKGITNQEEFTGLVKHVAPAVGHHLHQEQASWLFTAALAASGNGALAVSPAGFATAVLDAGLVGSAAHLRRYPMISQRPPYSDCRLLGASWQAVKPPLKEVLRMLPKTQPALAPEVSAVSALVQRLDEAMSAAGPAGDAWQLYRRILGFYCEYGSFPEACSVPSTPRILGGSAAGGSVSSTPRQQPNAALLPS